MIAAFLAAQLEQAEDITARRLAIWDRYHAWAAPLEVHGLLRRPLIPISCTHNAHMYYLLLQGLEQRSAFIAHMKDAGVACVFHYIPLHSSPAGQRLGRAAGMLRHTDQISDCLVRLPLWLGLEEHLEPLLETAHRALVETASPVARAQNHI
ncbi:MAG TPA: DegT/DnrJ/EryC1/StrS family aminotransferase [Rhodanobacter sp.]